MDATMMRYQLTIPAMARRAAQLHPDREIVSRLANRELHRTTYAEVLARSRRLIGALRTLGVRAGDRVATFCWNHHQHLEAYYAVPSMGAVLHTLNIRLHADELTYIANHAGDSVVIVDRLLLSHFETFRSRIGDHEVIVVDGGADLPAGMHDYETLIAASDEAEFEDSLDEWQPASMCYTSGTTGRSKGVVYSHRSIVLHSLALGLSDLQFTRERDVILAVVPMFHASAWGLPFAALLHGASQIFPGPFLDPASILDLISGERVTTAFGVPTILMGVLHALDTKPDAWDLSALQFIVSGGAPAPESMMRAFEERHGIRVLQAWGMTETSPLGSVATLTHDLEALDVNAQYRHRVTIGRPAPFVETRVRTDSGLAPWDGATMGELEVRGPWVAGSYHDSPESADRFTDDGWFKTGDIVTIDERGYMTIRDRSKDVIKSGGEWISSVALENMLMQHPAVLEAAVIGLRHPRWDERPLAVVVPRPGHACTPQELLDHLAHYFPKWWMPSGVEFAPAIPRTSVGKFNKLAMREQYRDYFATQVQPSSTPTAPSTAVTT